MSNKGGYWAYLKKHIGYNNFNAKPKQVGAVFIDLILGPGLFSYLRYFFPGIFFDIQIRALYQSMGRYGPILTISTFTITLLFVRIFRISLLYLFRKKEPDNNKSMKEALVDTEAATIDQSAEPKRNDDDSA